MYLERDWGGRLRAPVAQRALGCHLGLKCAWPHPWVGWAGQVDPHAVRHGAWVPSLLLWIQRGHGAERASWQHRLVPSGKRTPPSVGPAETVHRPVLCSRGRHGVNSASVGTLLLGGLGVTRPRQAQPRMGLVGTLPGQPRERCHVLTLTLSQPHGRRLGPCSLCVQGGHASVFPLHLSH